MCIRDRHSNKRSIINQREVGLDTKSYERALRGVMRAAPDVYKRQASGSGDCEIATGSRYVSMLFLLSLIHISPVTPTSSVREAMGRFSAIGPVPVARQTACIAVERDSGTKATVPAGSCQLNARGGSAAMAASVRLDTHALGLGRRDLRDRHFQHSIDMACLDLILLHVVRQREASQERAFHALEALESFLILTAFNVSLATQREHTVVRRDADVFRLDAGQVLSLIHI